MTREDKANYLKLFLHSIEVESKKIPKDSQRFRNMQSEYDIIASILHDYEPDAKVNDLKENGK